MIRLPITKARTLEVEGCTWLELDVAGTLWIFDAPKASFCQAGFLPLPEELAQYGETYSLYGEREEDYTPIPNCTSDPVALELARQLWIHELKIGEPVRLPSFEEASAARWEIDPVGDIFRRAAV